MRTTVTIDDDLLRQARELALSGGRSLGDVVDDALRVLLGRRAGARRAVPVLPIYGGSGVQPGVDLEDKEALTALLDDPHPRGAASPAGEDGGVRAAG